MGSTIRIRGGIEKFPMGIRTCRIYGTWSMGNTAWT